MVFYSGWLHSINFTSSSLISSPPSITIIITSSTFLTLCRNYPMVFYSGWLCRIIFFIFCVTPLNDEPPQYINTLVSYILIPCLLISHMYFNPFFSYIHILLSYLFTTTPWYILSPTSTRRPAVPHIGQTLFRQGDGEEASGGGVAHVSTGT